MTTAAALALLVLGRVISLNEALQIAAEHQPQLRQAHANTEASLARADEGKAPLLPQLNGTGTYTRTTANYSARPGSVPTQFSGAANSQPQTFTTYNYYNFGLNATQLVYDFGQSHSRWQSLRATADAQRSTEHATTLQILLNVRTNYFSARANKAMISVARDTLANQEKHLHQIEGFVTVGTRPEIDLAQSKTDLANAKVQLINAENGYETAKALLNQAIGVEQSTDYDISDDTMAPIQGENLSIEPLLDEALKARPEFNAVQGQLRAAELTLTSFREAYLPSLGVFAGTTETGSQWNRLAPNANAGVSLTWPIYQGNLTLSQEREASANLDASKAQMDILRLQVRVEVEQTRLAVRAAKEAQIAAEEAAANAHVRLTLAEGRYTAGAGSVIELGDAQIAATTAAAQRVQADYNLSSTRAQLFKALGRL